MDYLIVLYCIVLKLKLGERLASANRSLNLINIYHGLTPFDRFMFNFCFFVPCFVETTAV